MSKKLILLTLATILVATLISAGATAGRKQSAARSFSVGIYDDGMTLANPDKGFPILHNLRAQVVRITLWWGGPIGVAKKQPKNPTNPADPAYNWDAYDRAVQDAAKYKIKVLFSIVGTPAWANGGRAARYAPTRPVALQNFATAAAKRYAEAMTMAYHRQQGVDTAIARIFNTYGPRMRPHDGRAIPTFVRQAVENKPLTVFGDGSQTRSFCYVDDLIQGLYALAMSEEHLPVNLGNPTELTLLELAQTVIRVTSSKSELVFEALPIDDPQVREPDITRARQVLGWEPKIPLEEGLRRMLPSEEREAEAVHV